MHEKLETLRPLLWIGFNCLKATEPLEESFTFYHKYWGVPATHLINFDRMKGWNNLNLEATQQIWTWDPTMRTALTTKIIGKTYLKCKCPVFANIKQTLQVSNRHLFFIHSFPYLCWIKFCSGCLRQVFFFIWGPKRVVAGCVRQVVSYAVTIIWELARADSALVILGEWLSYKGGRITRFDCS